MQKLIDRYLILQSSIDTYPVGSEKRGSMVSEMLDIGLKIDQLFTSK